MESVTVLLPMCECVETRRHRNRKLYAVDRMTCALDLSRNHAHAHTFYCIDAVNNECVDTGQHRTKIVERLRADRTSGAHCREKEQTIYHK